MGISECCEYMRDQGWRGYHTGYGVVKTAGNRDSFMEDG